MLPEAILIIQEWWNLPKCLSMDKENIVYIQMKYYSAIKKELTPFICNSMDGYEGHNVKWNKSSTER